MAGNPNWTPGKSGNPGGRPKMSPEEREKWAELATKAREKLASILDDPAANATVIARIAEIASNRAWGTPVQAVELSDPDGEAIKLQVEYVGQAQRSI